MSNYHDNKNILLESIDYNELIISKPRKKWGQAHNHYAKQTRINHLHME
jgi:hypothetical protein